VSVVFLTQACNQVNIPEVGTQSDIRDERNQTEHDIETFDIELKNAECDIQSVDIGLNFLPISDIRIAYVNVKYLCAFPCLGQCVRVHVHVLVLAHDLGMWHALVYCHVHAT
jgi:hypothetical protein